MEVIVQATTRVLLKEGYEACTTNRVAKEAGVSIGSLYQYFPNKKSLVVAVMERHQEQLRESIIARLAEVDGADLPTAVGEVVRALLSVQKLQPKLHRVLLEQVPRIGALKRLHELHGQYEPLIEAWLEANAPRLGLKHPTVAAYVLISACEGVVTRVMVERPAWLEQGVLEAQLVRLILSYLAGPPPRR